MMGSRLPYTEEEDKKLLEFFVNELRNGNKNSLSPKGTALWQTAQHQHIVDRSYESMCTHFRRHLFPYLPNIALLSTADKKYLEQNFLFSKKMRNKEQLQAMPTHKFNKLNNTNKKRNLINAKNKLQMKRTCSSQENKPAVKVRLRYKNSKKQKLSTASDECKIKLKSSKSKSCQNHHVLHTSPNFTDGKPPSKKLEIKKTTKFVKQKEKLKQQLLKKTAEAKSLSNVQSLQIESKVQKNVISKGKLVTQASTMQESDELVKRRNNKRNDYVILNFLGKEIKNGNEDALNYFDYAIWRKAIHENIIPGQTFKILHARFCGFILPRLPDGYRDLEPSLFKLFSRITKNSPTELQRINAQMNDSITQRHQPGLQNLSVNDYIKPKQFETAFCKSPWFTKTQHSNVQTWIRCGECAGCLAAPCNQCCYCLKSREAIGRPCIQQRCLVHLENELQIEAASIHRLPIRGCGLCSECADVDCLLCLPCIDRVHFQGQYLKNSICRQKQCSYLEC